LAPAGADARAVARAAARFEATTRLQDLMQRVLGDVDDESLAPAAAELNDLYNRVEAAWLAWRQRLGDRPRPSAESQA
jgi:hypothetical protein